MKLLIAGAGTPVAKELVSLLKRAGIDHQIIPDRFFSGDDLRAMGQLLDKYCPDQLINLYSFKSGSQTAVYKAEAAAEKCRNIHQKYAEVLAGFCAARDIPLIHLSTCYVFDGEKKLGYNEQDDADPVGVYGKTALQGEQAVASLSKYIILRTGWMFGPNQCDVIKSWIKTCKKNTGKLQVTRRRFSPTPGEDLARVLLGVCHQVDCDANAWGTYHYCGLETKKESEFVQQVLKYASQHDEEIYQLLDSFEMSEAHTNRPEVPNTTLSSKKIFDTFGIKQRSWHESLKNTIKSLYQGAAKSDTDEATSDGPRIQLPDSLSSKSLH